MFFIALIIGFPAILLVHEVGHLVAARWFGVRVLSISVGIGREVCGFSDGRGIRWAIAVLPIGASIKLHDNTLETEPNSLSSDMLSSKPLVQRAVICAAGPLFNLLLAFCIWALSFLLFGETAPPGGYSEHPAALIASWLSLVSIFVGIFNLLPIPPLDGGALAFIAIEAAAKKPIPAWIRTGFCRAGMLILTVAGIVILIVGASEIRLLNQAF
jgi:membrane-associated protease RseP (regulator of RpoE activity)